MNAVIEAKRPSSCGAAQGVVKKCLLCGCKLGNDGDDDIALLCGSCKGRPEARRLGPDAARQATQFNAARAFTEAEKGLIRKVHGFMPAADLLRILNERLVSDLGPDALPYSMEQLHAEVGVIGAASGGPRDWPSLRKLLTQARRRGILQVVTEQQILDFCVVYSLNAKQAMLLKDIVLGEQRS